MNRLSLTKRAQIVQMLVEGASLRSISRIADVSINTVTKLLVDVASAAYAYHFIYIDDSGDERIRAYSALAFADTDWKDVFECIKQ